MFLKKHSHLSILVVFTLRKLNTYYFSEIILVPKLRELILYFYLLNSAHLYRYVYFTSNPIRRIKAVLNLFCSPLTPAIFSKKLTDAGSGHQGKKFFQTCLANHCHYHQYFYSNFTAVLIVPSPSSVKC
uniref:Uncharacterized protein n=1 Tax=Molossus molossus TaxID=27622 RepID=A0A7J8GKV1_MOLMO|nr:hypothetical protein HJG59_011473 [Molossus molossus]